MNIAVFDIEFSEFSILQKASISTSTTMIGDAPKNIEVKIYSLPQPVGKQFSTSIE